MKKFIIALFYLTIFSQVSEVFAGGVQFSKATVALVETRADVWGSWIIFTLNDSSGNRIMKLCDVATDTGAISLPVSDSTSKLIMGIALTAKVTGKTVTGWGLDATKGSYCEIANFAIEP